MTPTRETHSGQGPRRAALVAGAAAVLALVVGLAATAGAENARMLGKTKKNPRPNCPGDACEVYGQVTGFQRGVDRKKNMFRVPKNGRIVAWSVRLSKPTKEERDFFGDLAGTEAFGKRATAGISILGKRPKKRYRLVRKSPIVVMDNYLGETPIITLSDPLRVRQGQVVALTTVTWLPNFAADRDGRPISRDNIWIGSRTQKDFPRPSSGGPRSCAVPPNVPPQEQAEYFFDHSSPHRKVGSQRRYQCLYTNARLMYWAYFVPKN
jgi:hypothetical protein